MRKNPWPSPHNPSHLFAKALLVHGPLPPKGWSVVRKADGSAAYVNPRGPDARKFTNTVVDMFSIEVQNRYAMRAWKANHCNNVARKWKNEFLLWVWEQLEG